MEKLEKIKKTNDEIYQMETQVLQLTETVENDTERANLIKQAHESAILEKAAKLPKEDKSLSNEAKKKIAVDELLKDDLEYNELISSCKELKKTIKLDTLKISYYKRIFRMMLAFKEEEYD